jgi:hypothetical protein
MRFPDFAHPALADGILNAIRAELRACDCLRGGGSVPGQQRFDFGAKIRIGAAGFGEKRFTADGRTFTRGMIEIFDLPPAFRRDGFRRMRCTDYSGIWRSDVTVARKGFALPRRLLAIVRRRPSIGKSVPRT